MSRIYDFNRGTMSGNLVADAQARVVGTNTVLALTLRSISLLDNGQESTGHFHIDIWNRPDLVPLLKKGRFVLVEYQLQQKSFSADGSNKHDYRLRAANVMVMQ